MDRQILNLGVSATWCSEQEQSCSSRSAQQSSTATKSASGTLVKDTARPVGLSFFRPTWGPGWSMQRDSEGWDKKPMNEHSKLGSIISSTHRNHGNGFGGELTMEVLGFWQREVTEPCMLYLAKSTNLQALVEDDAPISRQREVITTSTSSMPSQPSQAARPSKRARGPDIREHKVGEDGNYNNYPQQKGSWAVQNVPIWWVHTKRRGYCAKNGNRRHQCSKCLSELHGAQQCQSEGPKQPRANHGKKGRGKGKKWHEEAQSVHANSGVRMKTELKRNSLRDTSIDDTGSTLGAEAAEGRSQESNASGCILHLFSGPRHRPDGLAAKLKSLGWLCIEYDVVKGPREDLTNDYAWQQVKNDSERSLRWADSRTTLQHLHQCPKERWGGTTAVEGSLWKEQIWFPPPDWWRQGEG